MAESNWAGQQGAQRPGWSAQDFKNNGMNDTHAAEAHAAAERERKRQEEERRRNGGG